ncbi:alpha/beta hydrolase family protein [Nonomuraea sp. LPB2021202275-12-8]|uniref:alpha/beta hydrolase family protein n=1 Tax=Nonomuraea sp. LPB2021202275-12-8 TaxID=3120159 RepID=UPI00300D05DD
MAELRHLGAYSGLAEVAAHQSGAFPDAAPGPELRQAARAAIGTLDLTAEDVRTERTWTAGDLAGEELSWSVGYGPRTHAYLLRPREAAGPLPGVLALHCHAGMKWAGKEKIADGPEPPTPEVARLREQIYGGRAYACELARRGFAVLAHDVVGWGSRRFALEDMPERVTALAADPALSPADRYDVAAGHHEHVLEKYCTLLGTSLAGVVAGEDLAAAAYLRGRPDVGPVGCVGLSGGGLRAGLLGAFDPDVSAVAIAAMISSYRDLLDGYVASHTWMLYPPGLSRLCDWPALVAARVPRPLLALYGERDELFPPEGMRRAHEAISRRYPAGGYEGVFFDAPHAFDQAMQEHAFAWLADRLRP